MIEVSIAGVVANSEPTQYKGSNSMQSLQNRLIMIVLVGIVTLFNTSCALNRMEIRGEYDPHSKAYTIATKIDWGNE